ncbi:glutathione peroxidase [Acidihalobacter prosperus]|uniref:Glutathione peroxidase n=1 Tax=Acidihalobacter prosperus TaxID=160660 RepID=A0A1A6C5F7_9GAMM|nr:glutathione peroxidase [Acidihalobacter prosperus]OBS09780.1 glutathione peroxidase [Acidihalobacter prosperus]
MFENREGQRVPEVVFKTRRDNEWVDVNSRDIFAGRDVVVFSLPGAFTPTCSSSHVPRYDELAPVFRACGIDEIVCISVNDAFVMNQWREDQAAHALTFLPDGNGEFTEAMGMMVDKRSLGFGRRSWRYSMLVRDGLIEKMFVEPAVEGDPFEVSDADTLLAYLDPSARKPDDVLVFTRPGCPYCLRAKGLLSEYGVPYEEIRVGEGIGVRGVRAATGRDTVPQIFVNGAYLGDSEALAGWIAARGAQAA